MFKVGGLAFYENTIDQVDQIKAKYDKKEYQNLVLFYLVALIQSIKNWGGSSIP